MTLLTSREISATLDIEHVGEVRLVRAPASLEDIGPETVSFCGPKYEQALPAGTELEGSTLVCAERLPVPESCTLLISENPRASFAEILRTWFLPERESGISPGSYVHPEATLADDVLVGSGAVIEDEVVIGSGTSIGAGAVIGRRTSIGRSCSVGPNTVLGSVGYGFEHDADGIPLRIPHLGGVVVGDHVEIGALVSIARGTLRNTVVGDHAKIDDHVFIAHNVVVGERAMVIAHAEVSGGVVIGDDAWISPGATVLNKITIGARSTVGLGAVVIRDVAPDSTVVGNPAKPLSAR